MLFKESAEAPTLAEEGEALQVGLHMDFGQSHFASDINL